MTDSDILAVLVRHRGELMAIPGVVGVAEGLCNGEPCIKVFVTRKTPVLAGQLPSLLEGFPIGVEETGDFRPFQARDNSAQD